MLVCISYSIFKNFATGSVARAPRQPTQPPHPLNPKEADRMNSVQLIANFYPDPLEGGYTAIVPSLRGAISEGDTLQLALDNITEAAELYLEVRDGINMQGKVIILPQFPEGSLLDDF